MRKNTFVYKSFWLVSLFPALTLGAFDGIKDMLNAFSGLIKLIVPIIFGLALVYFFWGIGQFILHSDDQKTRAEGRNKIVFGIIALFVMFSILGILNWIGSEINIIPGKGSAPNPGFNLISS